MKTPRTVKIVKLMVHVITALMHNERFGFQDSLAELDSLGGIYIKFLQMAALSSGGVGQQNFLALLKVYEDSQPDNIEIWRHLNEVKAPNLQNLASLDGRPFATGSFGQVYRATLSSGEEVIVKVLRPSVKRYLHYDLRLLRILCGVFSLFDRQKMLNFNQIYSQFKATCLQEISYKREVEVADYYYKSYQDHPQMVIPKTYLDMCNDQVIVQDYIEGISVAKLLAMQTQGIDARAYAYQQLNSDIFAQLKLIGVELLSKALVGDVIQADPHPGNIIILTNNRVALIDFGMATTVHENRIAFYELMLQYQAYYSSNFEIEELALAALKYLSPKLFSAISDADKFFDGSEQSPEKLLERLKRVTHEVAYEDSTRTVIESMLADNLIMKVLFFAVNKGNRFGFTFDLRAVSLLKATQGYMSLIAQFDKGTEIVTGVIDGTIDYAQQNLSRVIDTQQNELEPLESLEILSTWLDKMARNDPWLMNHLIGGYIE